MSLDVFAAHVFFFRWYHNLNTSFTKGMPIVRTSRIDNVRVYIHVQKLTKCFSDPRPATMSGQHPQQPPRQGGGGSFNPNAASFVPNLNAPAFVPGQHFQPGGYYQQPPPGGFYNPQMAPPPNMYAPPPPHMMPHQQYYHPAPPMSDAQEQRQQQMFAGQAQPQQQHAQPPIECEHFPFRTL